MNKASPQSVTQQCSAWENPMGTDGFEFIEYAAPDPKAMGELFERMGFKPIARHRHKKVLLYRQGGINFIVNAEPDSFAQRFARQHGPSICAIAFRVRDAKAAYERVISLGAWGYAGVAAPGELNIPAIKGIGDSLIYLVDRWRGKNGAKEGDIGCGRDGGYPPPPAQIRTCRITAYGSCLRYVTRRTAPQGMGACCGRAERSA